jgi:anti-anti-sigma factor
MMENLDQETSAIFREQVASIIDSATGPVLLDCSRLKFIDCSGVGALLHVNKLLQANQRPLRLTGVSNKLMALLELLQINHSFELSEPAPTDARPMRVSVAKNSEMIVMTYPKPLRFACLKTQLVNG